jgi:hypothetical protein
MTFEPSRRENDCNSWFFLLFQLATVSRTPRAANASGRSRQSENTTAAGVAAAAGGLAAGARAEEEEEEEVSAVSVHRHQ